MPTFERIHGDAGLVVSVGNVAIHTEAATAGQVVSTGIGKPPTFLTISNVASMADALGTGEAVEEMLKVVSERATILAYQVNTTVLSLALEGADWTTTNLQSNIVALGSNVNGTGFDTTTALVRDYGLKLATS